MIHTVTTTDDDIDRLFDMVDGWFQAGRFATCDDYLRSLDVSTFDTQMCVAVLSITRAASHELKERETFVSRARARLLEIAPARVDDLMRFLD